MRSSPALYGVASLALVLQLSACGGGGGSPSPPPPPPPPPPLILAQSFIGTEDTESTGNIATTPAQGGAVTVSVTVNPTRGTLTAFSAQGVFMYRPNPDLNGADTFTVEAVDVNGNRRATANITVNVAPVNDAPVATGEIEEIATAPSLTLSVLANDTDIDDTNLSVVIPPAAAGEDPNPAVGTATVDASNRINIALPANFRGVSRVRYRVRDAAGAESGLATALTFVGIRQFDLWYVEHPGTSVQKLMVTNLVVPREVNVFTAPRGYAGAWMSAQKNVVVIGEGLNQVPLDLLALPTPGARNQQTLMPVRLTPGHSPDQVINEVAVSPNGTWVAYVLVVSGVKQLWMVPVANPAARVQVPLPPNTTDLGGYNTMRFAPNSASLYFYAIRSNANKALMRAPVSDPLHPVQMNPSGDFFSYFIAADDSYVVTRYDNLYRVPVADPAARTIINAPVPNGHAMNSEFADPTATRFVYETTDLTDLNGFADDRLWVTDVTNPGVSTLVLDANPMRTGPISLIAFKPDRNAALLQTWTRLANDYQLDLHELSLSPADLTPRILNPPPPAGSRTSGSGFYIDDDSIVYVMRENLQLSRLYENRRANLAAPIEYIEPGIWSLDPLVSPDKSVLAFTHTRNTSADPSHYGVIVNRAVPGRMLRVTPAASNSSSLFVLGMVERP